jgi:CYTH domain-containing protein
MSLELRCGYAKSANGILKLMKVPGICKLNVYHGNLEGLVLAEVEFSSRDKSEEFEPPDWLGEEVTDDVRYKNQILAKKGAPVEEITQPQ